MEYRKIGNDSVSLLGFGCMRFPLTADGKIDEPKAEEMLKKAIDQSGINLRNSKIVNLGYFCRKNLKKMKEKC